MTPRMCSKVTIYMLYNKLRLSVWWVPCQRHFCRLNILISKFLRILILRMREIDITKLTSCKRFKVTVYMSYHKFCSVRTRMRITLKSFVLSKELDLEVIKRNTSAHARNWLCACVNFTSVNGCWLMWVGVLIISDILTFLCSTRLDCFSSMILRITSLL